MNVPSRFEIGLILVVLLIMVIPLGIVLLVSPEVPYYPVPGEPLKDAVQSSGITIVSVKDITWNLPGATGGKIYVLTDNAGNFVTVDTQSFDSAASRDAAIRLYHSHPLGRGKPVGRLIVIGQHLIYITPADSEILQRIAPALK